MGGSIRSKSRQFPFLIPKNDVLNSLTLKMINPVDRNTLSKGVSNSMKVLNQWLLSGLILTKFTFAAEGNDLKPTPLFNGKSLQGWTALPGGAWSVENGAIVGRSPKSEKRHGMLLSAKQYSDFVVTAKFRVLSGDSGFYFRSDRVETNVSVNGFQVEIDTSQETGGLYETGGRAWVEKPDPEAVEKRGYKAGEWTTLELRANGRDIEVKSNNILSAK